MRTYRIQHTKVQQHSSHLWGILFMALAAVVTVSVASMNGPVDVPNMAWPLG